MGSYKFKNLFTNLKTNNQKQSLELSFLWDFCCKALYCYADVYRLTFIGKSSRPPNVLTHHRYRFSKTRIKVFPNSAFFAKGDQPLESVIRISKYSQIFWSILIANFDSFESAINVITIIADGTTEGNFLKDLTSQLAEGFLILYVLVFFNVTPSFSMSVRLEASLEKKLETFWPVRNSELSERWFSSLSLAVIMDLAADAAYAFWPVVSPIQNLFVK